MATATTPAVTDNEAAMAASAAWFKSNNWQVFEFQRQAWQAWHAGKSGLIHSPTGSGKTLAAWLGPVQAAMQDEQSAGQLKVLWITPLRALATDTCNKLAAACQAHRTDLSVAMRTGDTSTAQRRNQSRSPPFALVTTPESLSLMLSHGRSETQLDDLHTVIVDEWHELLGSKRGVLLQLSLAKLRSQCPELRIWGISATLANLYQAMQVLLGPNRKGSLIRGVVPREIQIESVLPASAEHFTWSGHLGIQLLQPVVKALQQAHTSLVFTNTRSQAELWFQALLGACPDWLEQLALHHGSLDRALRQDIEDRLRNGELRCVVCTSSLDLGVDFSPVDQVLQIGSPKGVARLMQRAGRSGHQPGAISRVLCVPTHAFELLEIHAVRRALAAGRIESRDAPRLCLDVLCQHLVTVALGHGFVAEQQLAEVRNTHAFAELQDSEWQWVMDFITRGGQALKGYPQYHKVVEVAGVFRVMNQQVAERHRMAIGTITSSTQMNVAFRGGRRLGTTEESFIARLKPGNTFQFAGRQLELVRVREMTAEVKLAKRRSRIVPRWWGTQLPLSSELSDSVLATMQDWADGGHDHSQEMLAINTLLQLQQQWSQLPGPDDFLLEYIETQEGYSLFCYPFAGRLSHEGLAMLVASRLSANQTITLTLQINDYGFELHSESDFLIDEAQLRRVFSGNHLLDDILESINSAEVAKRRFRDIARIAGLVFEGYPGRPKTARQVQASSGLIFDVLENYDKSNLLLDQAHREVLEQQLEFTRLRDALLRIDACQWQLTRPARLTPLAFPLWTESLQSQTVSSESFQQRVQRMLGSLEQAAEATLHDEEPA